MTAQPAAPRAPLTVWLYLGFSWLLGWWLVYDGLHQRLWGDYVRLDGQLGPWASLATALEIDPLSLAATFIALGFALIGSSFGVYWQRRWGYRVAVAASALSLLYFIFGTLVALVCLVLLLLRPTRAYIAAGAAAPAA